MKRAGWILLTLVALVALLAPWLAPNAPDRRFDDHLYAPPTRVHLGAVPAGSQLGDQADLKVEQADLKVEQADLKVRLYVRQMRLVSRLERRFEQDETTRVPLRWFSNGRLVSVDEGSGPLLLLGADAFGRDILARLLFGARATLALAALATLSAILLGSLIGGISGFAGGAVDEVLSRTSDFILVLPAIYVALALRAVLPLVLPASTIFLMLALIFALLGWPVVARGVRAIVASERQREYAVASHALGASSTRLLVRHLLPAARSYIVVQATLLLPAFILAEATLSYVGLGFPADIPTWGTMLQDAANVTLLVETPWLLAPAAAIFVVVLAVNLAVQGGGHAPVQLDP